MVCEDNEECQGARPLDHILHCPSLPAITVRGRELIHVALSKMKNYSVQLNALVGFSKDYFEVVYNSRP